MVTRTGKPVPILIGHQIHGKRPNEVAHMDFLYLRDSTVGQKYVLILGEDFSSFVWLFPFEIAISDSAAEAIASWIATIRCIDWIMTDKGAYFKNRLPHCLTNNQHIHYYFTTVYSPWYNGTVERVFREVLRACKALLSELWLALKDWPSVIDCIQSILNHAPLRRL